jgi:hypothetical protein
MAEESSFLGVIERLRAEGQLDRNTGSNSIKSLKEEIAAGNEVSAYELDDISISARVQTNTLHDLRDAIVGNDLEKSEKEREQRDLLKSIAAGTNKPSKEKEKSEKKQSKGFFADLAILFAPIGGVLGKISPIFSKVGSLFSSKSPLFKIFGKGGSLAKFLPALGRVFSKVAFPLTIAFGVFKGIVEGIKGYKEGGIMGAIQGFFIGAFDAVIGDLALMIGNIGEKIFGLLGFDQFAGKFNQAIEDIIGGIKGVMTGIFDSIKALFSGDTEAFKEALSSILGSLKGIIVGEDGEGGIFGALTGLLTDIFFTFPEKINAFFDSTVIPFLTETVPTFLSETLLPKLLEVGQNIGRVIRDVFMDMVDMIKEKISGLIPEPFKKAGGFFKKVFSSAKDDGQTVRPVDPRFANAISAASRINKEESAEDRLKREEIVPEAAAVPESAAVPGVTGFSDQQQLALLSLEDALAEAKTEKDRLKIAAEFHEGALFAANQGHKGMFSNEFKAEQSRLFAESRNNTGAEMEVGMSNIADAKSQPAPVIVSGGEGAPQTTVVNNSNTTFNGSEHPEESNALTQPSYGYALA